MIGDGSVSVVTYSQKPMSIQFQKPNLKTDHSVASPNSSRIKAKNIEVLGYRYYFGLDAMNNLRKSISGDTEKPKTYQCMALFVCQLMEAATGGRFWDWSV
jgi:hypothetical protein